MNSLQAVCVYCGSSSQVASSFKQAAHDLGILLAQHGIDLVYGGGRVGLMGILADSALSKGGRVTGIIPEHIRAMEVEHTGLTELIVVDSMHTRKRLMMERSDAFVMLPGGLGTLDETIEVLTWKQLHLHKKPILIANIDGYWNPLLALLDQAEAAGFVRRDARQMISTVDRIADIPAAIAKLRATGDTSPNVETRWL